MKLSRNVNWREEWEKWEMTTRDLLSERVREDEPDAGIPMMNYAYPLDFKPSDEEVMEIYEETSCCVVYNTNEDSYYLALTGGGMDLSQDIALAYLIAESNIPHELLDNMCYQPMLSTSRKQFERLLDEADTSDSKRIREKVKEARKKLLSIK